MTQKPEKQLVEDYVVGKLEDLGWRFVPAQDLVRKSIREPLLLENLEKAILRINQNLDIGEEELKKVIDEIKLLTSGHEGAKKFLHFLKYGIGVKFEKERVVKIVNLFDFENPQNNESIFSRQVHFRGQDTIIPDIVLYINGVPLVDIECKNPASLRTGWEEGYRQIKEYEKATPEVYKYLQIGFAFAEKVRYFPIVPWQKDIPIYTWQKDDLPEGEAVFEMLAPKVLLDILRNFLFLREEHGEAKKILARYMQYRAVNKIYQRVIDNLEGETEKNKGLIWHWQGSGKTLTMIFAAHKLYFDSHLEKPTIFFIVDRKDLETQMNDELSSLKLNFAFEKIERVRKLKEFVIYDNFRGKRGAFLTLIHKFRPDEKFILEGAGVETIAQRKNVICFLDEVHRTQYGLLAAQMKKVLENAFFFGFTGTPIAEKERDTYLEFGYPLKDEGYLDKYFIDDSQKDGFTVPIVYLSKLEKMHIKQEDIRLFLEKVESEDIAEVDKEKLNAATRRRLNYIKVFLENENRIKKIAEDIAKHFKKNIDGRFKAMVVTGSRKACVYYKKYLERFLPQEYSEVVMTFNRGDKEPIMNFYNGWQKRYPGFADDSQRVKHIVDSFKEKQLPEILIVTDMLITGFDAPILEIIYLDKLLKKHRLLQATARVNRPYKDVKAAGFIVDYAGILKEFNSALKSYYKEDLSHGIGSLKLILEFFEKRIKELKEIFKGIKFKIRRENLQKAVERLRDEETEIKFCEKYKEARKLYELLGAYPEKLKYLEQFKWLTTVYEYWLKLKIEPQEKEKIEKYFQKTLAIVHQNIEIQKIEKALPKATFDLKHLDQIQKSALGLEEKAPSALFALEKMVLVHQARNPIFKSVAEILEELIKEWRERKIGYQELFQKETEIINFIVRKEKERKDLGVGLLEFGILSIMEEALKEKNKGKLIRLVKDILTSIKEYYSIENWQENPTLKQNIERETRTFLLGVKKDYQLSYEGFDGLHKKITTFLTEYEEK